MSKAGKSDTIVINGLVYMHRWRFLPDWMPGFRVHEILRSDPDRELHDHPFTFLSFILRGGYWEHRADGSRRWYGPGTVVFRGAETLHRLELSVEDGTERPAWTFVIRGRYRREWGFMTKLGWVHWKAYGKSNSDGSQAPTVELT